MNYFLKTFLSFFCSILLLSLTSCDHTSNINEFEDSEYYDGTYCAEITYYNPNTRNSSTYDLEIEVENNELIRIIWPNGGWLDQDHFDSVEFDEVGYCSFTSDKNYEYTVQIKDRDC